MENIGLPSEILIFRCPDAGKPGLQAAGMLQTASYMSQAAGGKVHATKLRQHSPNSSNLHQNSSQRLPTPPTSTKLPRLRQTPRNYISRPPAPGSGAGSDQSGFGSGAGSHQSGLNPQRGSGCATPGRNGEL